jgi:hypothetical protein
LRNQQVITIDAQLFGICRVKGVFRIDKGRDTVLFLGFGNRMQGKRGFTGCLGAINFNNSTGRLPNFIIEPLPNWRSTCDIAVSNAFSLSGEIVITPSS